MNRHVEALAVFFLWNLGHPLRDNMRPIGTCDTFYEVINCLPCYSAFYLLFASAEWRVLEAGVTG